MSKVTVVMISVLCWLELSACTGVEDCQTRSEEYCLEGVSYWVDSCGNLEEVKEFCSCGCRQDRMGCFECNCQPMCAGKQCGPDGCGGYCQPGCSENQFCTPAGACRAGACQPASCSQLGLECGTYDDGCGGTMVCGSCPAGASCQKSGKCQVQLSPPGTLKWRVDLGAAISELPAVLDDGTVIVATDDGSLHRVSPEGRVQWSKKLSDDFNHEPTVADDGTVYIGNGDFLFAVSPQGELLWKADLDSEINSAVALGFGRDIYIGTNYGLFSLDVSGSIRWVYAQDIHGGVMPPTVSKNGLIYFIVHGYMSSTSRYDSTLLALTTNKEEAWKSTLEGFSYGSASIDRMGNALASTLTNGIWVVDQSGYDLCNLRYYDFEAKNVAVGTDNSVYVVFNHSMESPFFGMLIAVKNVCGADSVSWYYQNEAEISGAPTLLADGGVIVTDFNSMVRCFDAATGAMRWSLDSGGYNLTPATVAPDGTIYVGSRRGYLVAIWGQSPLAKAPWPKERADSRNTGRQP